jgi:uncharacterized membrane protein YfcA
MDWQMIVMVLLIFVFAALVEGFLGFGFGIVAMGLLTLTKNVLFATALVNIMAFCVALSILWPLRRKVKWRLIGPLLVFGLAGMFAGVEIVTSFNPLIMRRVLGVTIVIFAAWSFMDTRQGHLARWWSIPAGLASGVLHGAFNTGGPPLIAYIYRHPFSPDHLKGTIQLLFVLLNLSRIPVLYSKGLFTDQILICDAIALPFVVPMTWLGIKLARKISAQRFRKMAWTAFAVMGLWLAIAG